MLNTIIDIETTGLDKQRDTILAVGYLTMDSTFSKVIDGDILYFYQEGQPESHPKALEVHGLTSDYLKQYEGVYTHNLQKLFKMVTKGSLIGHNSDQFDLPFIKEFLRKNAYGEVEWFQSFDTMKIYRPVFGRGHNGRVSLSNLMLELKIPLDGIKILQNHYYSGKAIKPVAHDATFDVTETLIAFSEAKRRNLV